MADLALAAVVRQVRSAYARRVAGDLSVPWWTRVIVTASSPRQAERYEQEIRRRREQGKLPAEVEYLVIPDPEGRRIGSGGATLNALRALPAGAGWWERNRVLVLHSGGDCRRLPEFSLSGKLFAALPLKTSWGDISTVFDETLAQSTGWAAALGAGVVVGSGDVVLTFDAGQLRWDRPGVCGVAMRQPVETGAAHGVYVVDEQDRVYSFLQKPSPAEVRAAGGLLEDGQVALDIGLLRFDPALAARLASVAEAVFQCGERCPALDLYTHVTLALTGQWKPGTGDPPAVRRLAEALRGVPFWCSVVNGDFTHVGTTTLFRELLAGDSSLRDLHAPGQTAPRGTGVLVDSALAGPYELGPGAVVFDCDLGVPVRAGRGAILHGLTGLATSVEVPENTVVHQVPVALAGGRKCTVIRTYGVEDDPKQPLAAATWFGRPMLETIEALALDPEVVWRGIPETERTLWNAALFPACDTEAAWACAQWMMSGGGRFSAAEWQNEERLSLETSAAALDAEALGEAERRRARHSWQATALALAKSGTDVRPLLANPPGVAPLAEVGRALAAAAARRFTGWRWACWAWPRPARTCRRGWPRWGAGWRSGPRSSCRWARGWAPAASWRRR